MASRINRVDHVDYRSWGIKLLLEQTTKTQPRKVGVDVVQYPALPQSGWMFSIVKRAWLVGMLGAHPQLLDVERGRGQISVARLPIEGWPDEGDCLVIEFIDGSVQIGLRALDENELSVAVDALMGGDKAEYTAAMETFGVAGGIADAIVRSRVKALRLRQTAATQGRTKASRRAMHGTR